MSVVLGLSLLPHHSYEGGSHTAMLLLLPASSSPDAVWAQFLASGEFHQSQATGNCFHADPCPKAAKPQCSPTLVRSCSHTADLGRMERNGSSEGAVSSMGTETGKATALCLHSPNPRWEEGVLLGLREKGGGAKFAPGPWGAEQPPDPTKFPYKTISPPPLPPTTLFKATTPTIYLPLPPTQSYFEWQLGPHRSRSPPQPTCPSPLMVLPTFVSAGRGQK